MRILFLLCCVLTFEKRISAEEKAEDIFPTTCHVCKHTVAEFLEELDASGKSKDVLQLGQIFQSEKPKKIVYNKSDLRFIEALENSCANIAEYKVHKDKPNQLRYAKDESSTFANLKKLKNRGVKVDLGYPDEMWDVPDAEVYQLKRQCETILEKHEDDFSNWYFNHQEENLYDWFCKDILLKGKKHDCFDDAASHSENEETDRKAKKKLKEKVEMDDNGKTTTRKQGEL